MVMGEWLTVLDYSIEPPEIRATLVHIKQQVEIARLQFRRITEDGNHMKYLGKKSLEYSNLQWHMKGAEQEETWKKALALTRELQESLGVLFADRQFLIIILARVYRLLRSLKCNLSGNRDVARIWKNYSKWLRDYDEYRGEMEHIEDKIYMKGKLDLGSYVVYMGYEFNINRNPVDVSETTRQKLEAFFSELLKAVKNMPKATPS